MARACTWKPIFAQTRKKNKTFKKQKKLRVLGYFLIFLLFSFVMETIKKERSRTEKHRERHWPQRPAAPTYEFLSAPLRLERLRTKRRRQREDF